MSCTDMNFDIDLGSLLINNSTIKSNNLSYQMKLNSCGLYEFSCEGYTDHSRWVNNGIY